ncbi:MAG: adenine phosphoribosyltransferase [Chloroflexi bacterium 13_1_40CM_65_17]|nr:MAG: adenine phosphoribosyltransferase [Chloroflexi bacterium 13_1_40CM_65_17]
MSVNDEDIRRLIRDVPDFPQPGIIFKDITPLLADKVMFRGLVEKVCSHWTERPPDIVTAIEARGFIPGGAVALGLGAGFVPIRKPGKLPWKTVSQDYQLEYGTDQLQIHEDAVKPGQTVLIVDDVLATGGTAAAATELIRKLGGIVLGVHVLIELSFLEGRGRLHGIEVVSELVY